jgi:LCP family protein required for cell wall assembly
MKLSTGLKWAGIVAALMALCFIGGNWLGSVLFASPEVIIAGEDDDGTGEVYVISPSDKRVNILLLGVDARNGESDDSSRSDVMMLASIDPQLKKVALISFPRDSRVSFSGGYHKLGEANYYGGVKLVAKVIEDLMKIKLDYYVRVDFTGFSAIIDAIGGVSVDVAQRMYKPTEDIDLSPGAAQTLNGRQALAYVRYRDYNQGDITRTEVQQQFLKALADKILQPASLTKIPTFIRIAHDNMTTDMGIREMLRLGSWGASFNSADIMTQTLPGYFYDERDEYDTLLASYWGVDEKAAATLLEKMFAGQAFTIVARANETKVIPSADYVAESEEDEDDEGEGEDSEADAAGDAAASADPLSGTAANEAGLSGEAGESELSLNPEEELSADQLDASDSDAPELPDILKIDEVPGITPAELEWQRMRLEEGDPAP